MKSSALILALLLAGCGGGSVDAPVNTVAAPPVITVAFMGDSITATWDTASCVPGSFNVGIPGNFTWQMRDRFQADVLDKKPAFVLILGGTNDVAGGAFFPVGIDAVREMATMAKAAGVTPIIGTIPPNSSVPTTWGWGPQIVPAWNSQIKTMTNANGFKIVDFYPLFLNPDWSQNMALYDNPTHPNTAGRLFMCDALKTVMQQL